MTAERHHSEPARRTAPASGAVDGRMDAPDSGLFARDMIATVRHRSAAASACTLRAIRDRTDTSSRWKPLGGPEWDEGRPATACRSALYGCLYRRSAVPVQPVLVVVAVMRGVLVPVMHVVHVIVMSHGGMTAGGAVLVLGHRVLRRILPVRHFRHSGALPSSTVRSEHP